MDQRPSENPEKSLTKEAVAITTNTAPKKEVSQELLDRLAKAREKAAEKRAEQRARKELAQQAKSGNVPSAAPVVPAPPVLAESSTDSSDTSDSEDEAPMKRRQELPAQIPDMQLAKLREKYKERYRRRYEYLSAVRNPPVPEHRTVAPPQSLDLKQASRMLAHDTIDRALSKELLTNTMRSMYGIS